VPDYLTIGELARLSGLTASALRFYDKEGVLAPADVDPAFGYRRYAPEQVPDARVVAPLRPVGMPLSELALVLDLRARGQLADARDIVMAHQARLEEACAMLGAALASVRFGVLEEPEEPFGVLAGVLVEVVPGGLRLVATDRYRLAVAKVSAEPSVGDSGPDRGWVLPLEWLDEVVRLAADGDVRLELDAAACRAEMGGRLLEPPAWQERSLTIVASSTSRKCSAAQAWMRVA